MQLIAHQKCVQLITAKQNKTIDADSDNANDNMFMCSCVCESDIREVLSEQDKNPKTASAHSICAFAPTGFSQFAPATTKKKSAGETPTNNALHNPQRFLCLWWCDQ